MRIKDLKIQNLGFIAYLVFFIVCPIFFYSGEFFGAKSLRLGQLQFFQLGITILFAVCFLENIYLGFFLGWCVFLYAFHKFLPPAGAYVMNVFLGCLLYQITYHFCNKDRFVLLMKCLVGLVILNVIMLGFQAAKSDFAYNADMVGRFQTDLVGLMGLKAFMGMFFALMVPVVGYFNLKYAPLMFIPIYISDCTAAMLGGLVALIWCLWHRCRQFCVVLTLICLVFGGMYAWHDHKQNNMMQGRWNMWIAASNDAIKHPIVGWGLDSFRHYDNGKNFMYFHNNRSKETQKYRFHQETNSFIPPKGFAQKGDFINPWDHPHNEYVSIFFMMGIVPFIILGFLINDIRRRFTPYKRELICCVGVFLCFALFSIGQFPFNVVRLGFYAPVFLGMYYKLTDGGNHECS